MALPIKETPILDGNDAERFEEQMERDEQNRLSAKEIEKIMRSFWKLQAIAKFES